MGRTDQFATKIVREHQSQQKSQQLKQVPKVQQQKQQQKQIQKTAQEPSSSQSWKHQFAKTITRDVAQDEIIECINCLFELKQQPQVKQVKQQPQVKQQIQLKQQSQVKQQVKQQVQSRPQTQVKKSQACKQQSKQLVNTNQDRQLVLLHTENWGLVPVQKSPILIALQSNVGHLEECCKKHQTAEQITRDPAQEEVLESLSGLLFGENGNENGKCEQKQKRPHTNSQPTKPQVTQAKPQTAPQLKLQQQKPQQKAPQKKCCQKMHTEKVETCELYPHTKCNSTGRGSPTPADSPFHEFCKKIERHESLDDRLSDVHCILEQSGIQTLQNSQKSKSGRKGCK